MKKIIVSSLLLSALCGFNNGFAQEHHHRVKVNTGANGLQQMAAKGIAVDHGIVKKGLYFISDFSDAELALLQDLGLSYEVQIEDVASYYENRNQNKLEEKPRDENGCLNCEDYQTPQNFALGSMGGFYTYTEMLNILDSMRVKYPNLISVKQAISSTQSTEGRPIYYVRISNNPNVNQTDKPEVLYTALHHAREAQSLSQLIFYMWYLLENYDNNAEVANLLNNRELYFVPCINPDGYIYNQTTNPNGGGMWRKNRKNNGGGTFGVDLNRNYDSFWGYDNQGSSPVSSTETYRGTSAFSENETQAIRNFCNAHDFKIALNAHTFSNLLIYPYSHIPDLLTADSSTFFTLADEMTACSGFKMGTPNQTVGYSTNGDSDGWMFDEQNSKGKIFAMTPEAGSINDGFWPMQSRIIPIAKNTMQQNLYAARLAAAHADIMPYLNPVFSDINSTVNFDFKRTGIEYGVYEVSIVPISSNIASVGNPKVYTNPAIGLSHNDNIEIHFNANIAANDEIKFALKWSHPSGASWSDTITSVYGVNSELFYSDGNSLSMFEGTGWGISTTEYTSPTGSISESPNGAQYEVNQNKSLTTANWIDLTNASSAILRFDAKWETEKGFDYAAIQVQKEGNSNWTTLCGKYTSKGTAEQNNQPVFDGNSKDWKKEQMDLSPFVGNKIKIKVIFISDGYGNGDGFSFDEMKVIAGSVNGTSINTAITNKIQLSNVPNPCKSSTQIQYKMDPSISNAKLVIRDISGRLILQTNLDSNKKSFNLDVSKYSDGMYFYRIESGNQFSKTQKMIVIK